MATLNFQFTFDSINTSAQAGDLAYYVSTTSVNSFDTSTGNIILFGEINSVTDTTVTIAWDNVNGPSFPQINDYIMFGKKANVNTASLIGYFAEAEFVNNSHEYAELFSVGTQISENSK